MRRRGAALNAARDGFVELVRPGETSVSGQSLARLGRLALTAVIVMANLIGAGAVVVVAMFVVPVPPVRDPANVRLVNGIVAAVYVALAVPVGVIVGTRSLITVHRWVMEERAPDPREQLILLRAPLRLFYVQLALWLLAALVFLLINLAYSTRLALQVALTIALTGATTGACAYLLAERILRPAAVRALADGTPERLAVSGVATRATLAWALSTGIPLFGVVAVGVATLAGEAASSHQLAIAMAVLGGTALIVGLLVVSVAARATADPINSVRRALARVEQGDYDVEVPVYDATQIGRLQLGFNRMVEGLAERERIRDAFGTYVDPQVAERILSADTNLDGDEVEVTIMFVDIRNFTGFAERHAPREVVAAVNRLFELVVPIIHAHGGHVDKFIGDGLLAVFGAPRRDPDHADHALAAALEIERAVRAELGDELEIGIGLDSGTVLAGNIGGGGRLEFGVIGDAVNTAARVEAATRQTGDTILVSERTRKLLRATDVEMAERPDVTLKGKREPVRLYAPVHATATARP